MNYIDLCCGCGGWSEGLRQAGLTSVLGVDSWNIAIQSYHDNFPQAQKLIKKVQDLTADELPAADVIVGSTPCQKASIANIGYKGEIDYGPLHAVLDLIEEKKPLYWLLENVPDYWKMMPDELRDRVPKHIMLKACEYGLHHTRKRVFFGDFPTPHAGLRAPVLFWTPRAVEHKQGTFKTPGKVIPFHQYLGGRSPTPTEMLWAMGFPPGYRLAGTRINQITQVGNAVCPPVARAFGHAMMAAQHKENTMR